MANIKEMNVLLAAIFLTAVVSYCHAQTSGNEIRLIKKGSLYEVPVTVNDVLRINFIFDSGASDVSITPDVASTLIKTGTVTEWLSDGSYTFADGSTAKSKRFILKSVKIGNKTVWNVVCSIANNLEAPMLLGQSVLIQFGRYTFDYRKGVLIIDSDDSGINSPSSFDSRNNTTIDIPMVYVAGGTFTMGCTAEQGSDCYDVEKPAHRVTLNSYSIGRTEVTQAQWKTVMGNNPSKFKDDNLPVEQVSWNDIVGTSGSTQVINGITYYSNGFIYQLNQRTDKKYRLPTEAEWEFAARGGISSKGYKYSGSNTVDNVAWSDNKTHPVGTKQANELGIYDMSGNVWEWCSDWYGAYSSGSQINPRGASTGSYRVNRGGSWNDLAGLARVSYRGGDYPGLRNCYLGFRVACSP